MIFLKHCFSVVAVDRKKPRHLLPCQRFSHSHLILFFNILSPIALQQLLAGFGAYERGDYAAALSEFRLLAEQGDAPAQSALGSMYHFGRGVV